MPKQSAEKTKPEVPSLEETLALEDEHGVSMGSTLAATPAVDPPPLPERIPANMTLPELLADIVFRTMIDPKYMPQARKDIQLWYLGHRDPDPDKLREFVRVTSAEVQQHSNIAEGVRQTFNDLFAFDR